MVEARVNAANSGDVLNDQERQVVLINSSLYVNITAFARDVHGIAEGDTLVVKTTRGGIELLDPGGEGDE